MRILTCKTCGGRKIETSFYRQNSALGRHLSCIECVKDRANKYRADNLERVQEYDRQRGQLPHRKAGVKARAHRYWTSPREMRARCPEKYQARTLVGNAVRDGRLIRPDKCECCARDYRIQAHHDDYSKPLEVVWLCTICHGERHRELNAIRRAAAE